MLSDIRGQSVRLQYRVHGKQIREHRSDILHKPKTSVVQFLQSAFLPEGYPESVSADYLEYQKWDTIQALCSSVTGLLATQAILKGVGVGDANATAASALMQWIVRDGTGMAGRVVFAWFQGSNLDCSAKKWRLVADIMNDLALFVDLLSPMFPSVFLWIACLGSLLRAVVGVAGGATRAAVTQHQARRNNMADVSAKDGSQETAVNLIGMLLGLVITPMLNGNQTAIWTLFFVFTFLHLYANYRGVSCIIFDTVNQQRANIVLDDLMLQADSKGKFLSNARVMTPKQVAQVEKIFQFNTSKTPVIFGGRIIDLTDNVVQLENLMKLYTRHKYLLNVNNNQLVVVFHQECTSMDIFQGYFQAYIVRSVIESDKARKALGIANNTDLVAESYSFTQQHFDKFIEAMNKEGWNTQHNLLGASDWRAIYGAKLE